MCTYFSTSFDMMSSCMHVPIQVSTSANESLVVDQVYRSYIVSLAVYDIWVELIILGTVDFKIILCIDWLPPHHVILDYCAKIMTLTMSGLPRLKWNGSSGCYPRNFIYFIQARILVDRYSFSYKYFI